MKILSSEEFKLNESYDIDYDCKYTAIYVESGYHSSGWDFIGLESDTFENAIIELENSKIDISGNGEVYIVLTNTLEIIDKAFAKPIMWKADCVGYFKCEFISHGMGGSFSKKGMDQLDKWKTGLGEISRSW